MEKFTIVLPTENGESEVKKTSDIESKAKTERKLRKVNDNRNPAAEENTLLPDTIVDDNDEGDHNQGVKLLLILGVILVLALIGMRIFMKYTDSDVRSSFDREDSVESKYMSYKGNLLRYSTDGVFYTDMNGKLIWNYTYDMANPTAQINGSNILVFDKKGNEANFLNENGLISSVKTQMPIIDGAASKGNLFAILLQENNVSYVRLYDNYGELVAEGEIHPQNGGFPISVSLSSDGSRMALALINLNAGNINTTIDIYDYGKVGKDKKNNIIATYSYGNMLIPRVCFVSGDRLVAFGDQEIVIYNNNDQCTVEKEIFPEDEIRSLFYNDTHFGYVYEAVSAEGQLVNRLNIYNYLGFKNISVDIDEQYDDIYMMDNNEIVLTDAHNVSIYNIFGTNRFRQRFDANIYKVMPGSMKSRYYLIEEKYTEEISIK